jgi:hypothetical protein
VNVEGRHYTYGFLRDCIKPKLFVSGDHDPYSPRELLEESVANANGAKRLVLVEGAGHFFEQKLDRMQAAITDWVEEYYQPPVAASEQP